MQTEPNPIEQSVVAFLATTDVQFSVRYVGFTNRDDWQCDEWKVTLKGLRLDTYFEFYTGLGHRAEATGIERQSAKWQFPGVTAKDVTTLTRYGRAYLAEVEKLRKPKEPSLASVLSSFILDSRAIDQSFNDWCDESGYDTDSRKALKTYEACCEQGQKLRKLFTAEQRSILETLLQDY